MSLERADKKNGWLGKKLIVHLPISVTKLVRTASLRRTSCYFRDIAYFHLNTYYYQFRVPISSFDLLLIFQDINFEVILFWRLWFIYFVLVELLIWFSNLFGSIICYLQLKNKEHWYSFLLSFVIDSVILSLPNAQSLLWPNVFTPL